MNGFVNSAMQLAGCGSSYTSGSFVAKKTDHIRNPANKIMLAEEPVSTQDIPKGYTTFADDGRWVPGINGPNTITTRHSKRGNANFADGHAQPVDAKYASEPEHFDTTF
jgi:prepilin-type processing-associated H-X9-DG protein